MSRDEFIARLFEGFRENFPDLAPEYEQIVRDEIETQIFNEASLGTLRFDESGIARIEFAIASAMDRLGVPEVSENDD